MVFFHWNFVHRSAAVANAWCLLTVYYVDLIRARAHGNALCQSMAVLSCVYMSTCDVRLGQGKILHFHSFVPCECVRNFLLRNSFDFALFRLFFSPRFPFSSLLCTFELETSWHLQFVSVSRVANDSQFDTLEHINEWLDYENFVAIVHNAMVSDSTWKHTKYTKWPKSMIRTCDKMSKTIDQFDVTTKFVKAQQCTTRVFLNNKQSFEID